MPSAPDEPASAPPRWKPRQERYAAGGVWHVCGVLAVATSLTPLLAEGYWVFPFPLFASLVLWILSAHLRIAVRETTVLVHHGLFGEVIPLESIRKVEVVAVDWPARRGFGLRRMEGGRGFDFTGNASRAVRIDWVDVDLPRTVFFSSRNPDETAEAIERAGARKIR